MMFKELERMFQTKMRRHQISWRPMQGAARSFAEAWEINKKPIRTTIWTIKINLLLTMTMSRINNSLFLY